MRTAHVHILHEDDGRFIVRRYLNFVPRVGDTIRTGVGIFYQVTQVIWVYDEPDCPAERVNIAVKDIEP